MESISAFVLFLFVPFLSLSNSLFARHSCLSCPSGGGRSWTRGVSARSPGCDEAIAGSGVFNTRHTLVQKSDCGVVQARVHCPVVLLHHQFLKSVRAAVLCLISPSCFHA